MTKGGMKDKRKNLGKAKMKVQKTIKENVTKSGKKAKNYVEGKQINMRKIKYMKNKWRKKSEKKEESE